MQHEGARGRACGDIDGLFLRGLSQSVSRPESVRGHKARPPFLSCDSALRRFAPHATHTNRSFLRQDFLTVEPVVGASHVQRAQTRRSYVALLLLLANSGLTYTTAVLLYLQSVHCRVHGKRAQQIGFCSTCHRKTSNFCSPRRRRSCCSLKTGESHGKTSLLASTLATGYWSYNRTQADCTNHTPHLP